ncbi:uncharacterized protein BDV17DRAFT_294750 [Aspergillus undulatus]|uniref:uncharacterized protein n=1 Tax=Aspergillus undulatus TaxID=1810928 RepID=UPI003CCDC6A0
MAGHCRVGAQPSSPRIGIDYLFALRATPSPSPREPATGTKTAEGYLSLQADSANPSTIKTLFETVKSTLGASPAVVVYNAASLTLPPDESSILPYVAAQLAVQRWSSLDKDVKKTFIYTGNILNTTVYPVGYALDLGVGKAGSAYWVGAADGAYEGRGYRALKTAAAREVVSTGPRTREFYAQLAEHEGDVPWFATFVKAKGYVKF